ncbi:apolipoprotein B-100 [Pungitius pungitius]|uniref:apolipoprotein B-100 n=1 Tax=Pungitius pungitius TaxID=134920 RepID=UPI002E14311F
MMGYDKLCLLLLLSTYTLAQEGNDSNELTSTCLLASGFKTYKKYVYHYTTESRNGVIGNLKNGPQVYCQVEIEVPQTCSFVMHTRDCALREVSKMDHQGLPVYKHSHGSEAFQAAMERNSLKFTVEGVTRVYLYPETDEPDPILNIKRGILSALIVPVMGDEENSSMSTVHGQCLTNYLVHDRKDSATHVKLSRDLSQCDQFYSKELVNSPLALLQRMHRPLSKLMTSTQDCNYQFDNKGKHIMVAMCTEKHFYLPSYTDGISSKVTQNLSFQSSKRIINKIFDINPSHSKPLYFQDTDDKAPAQTKDTALGTLNDLMALAGTNQGQRRTSLFHKLVSSLRVLRNETLSQTVPEMLDVSDLLTWQALFQCGTIECTSAIIQALRTIDGLSPEADALIYGLSLQANPDATLVRDMLSMAQYKQSRAIMYALANTVKKFHKAKVTQVVTDVSKFMETLLNDCLEETFNEDSDIPSGPKENTFLVLRVVGVMGKAMQAVSPSLISSILRCAKKTDIPLSNQKAAVQAFRLMDINDEVKNSFMEVFKDAQSPVEKRVAAYLILMKNPDQALVRDILNNMENVVDEQLKSFVVSHLKNIRNSDEPQMYQLKEYIESALRDQLLPKVFNGMSINCKMDSPLGSVQSNIIFDGTDTLPKEMMLETTLNVFNYNYDIFEVFVEGTGFEPTIDALFGEQGFFPDTISKVMYWAGDKAKMLKGVLDRIAPERYRMKRQVSHNLLKDISKGVKKLLDDVHLPPAPEAIGYLRLLGAEIGYMKTSDMTKMAETLFMYYNVFFKVQPAKAIFALMSSSENEVFAHYIFMETAFSLPTAAGFPLKFSLAGVFAPGAKGGLSHSPANIMSDFSFMPSVGLEFITQMWVHISDYVEAGLEMHTNMYHESSLNAKVTMSRNQMKLSIPAPIANTQLFSISNKLLSVSSSQTSIVPPLSEERTDSINCQPLFRGLRICSIVSFSNATSIDEAPFYLLTGDKKFALEIQPTGDVSEYTATLSHGVLREGKKSRHKVESLKLTMRAEGYGLSEVTASLNYNRNKNTLTTEVSIPDYDVEAGVKLTVTGSNAEGQRMRGITVDVTSKNIPQLTLVGHTRLDMMKDAMLQLKLLIPFLKTEASVTAILRRDEDIVVDLEAVMNLPETSYQQKASFKYDVDKFEVELKSNLDSEIEKLILNINDYHNRLQQIIDHILEKKVAKTDMKLRHIVMKGIEAGDIWLDKLTARIPYLANRKHRKRIYDITLAAMPEKLFLQSNSLFRYQFNTDRMVISLPLPHGGTKSQDLNIPTTLSIPPIYLPVIGLYIPAKKYSLPAFTIPPSLDFTVPFLGLAEASTKINSNVYNWEGSISGGNNTVNVPSYIAQYKAMAKSPFNLLAYKFEGTGMISVSADGNIKYLLNSFFNHGLIDANFSVIETIGVTNEFNAKANYHIKASSPLGLQASLYYFAQSTSTLDLDEVSGDSTMDGSLKIGSFYTDTSYAQSYNLFPIVGKGRGESTLYLNSTFFDVHNIIIGVYANSELNMLSKIISQEDSFKHVADLKYKNAQLTMKCNTIATSLGQSLNNKIELDMSSHKVSLKIESQANDDTNGAYSLIEGSLDSNGLEANSEGSITFQSVRGLHKASVMVGMHSLTVSGTNIIQCSPVMVENMFSGAIDNNRASLYSKTKLIAEESKGELNIDGQITATEATLSGVLKGHVYDATTRNNMDIVLNRRALTVAINNMGKWKQINTENSHALTLTLWTLALHSKTNNFICEDIYYKQDSKVHMKAFLTSLDMTNYLKFHDFNWNNEGHMQLEPITVDLSGSTKVAYGEHHNIKHTYELNYDNMAGSMKYCVTGNVIDAQLSHNCELEFAGLSSKSKCVALINSEPFRFESTICTMALPFSLTIDSLVNSDGQINLYGKHTGQLYSKLLVKTEALTLAYSHDSQVSTTHIYPSGKSSSNLENKIDGLLTPRDQSLIWKIKSKLNNHAYNQDVSAFHNPLKVGFEFSGVILTDSFGNLSSNMRSEVQEFSIAGFLKYDKNSDCHIIEFPFIGRFPVAFEQLKNTLANALILIQQFIKNVNINQLIIDFRAKLDHIPLQVSNFMLKMDLENKVNQVNAKLDYLINDFAVTMDDFEFVIKHLRESMENIVMDIVSTMSDIILTIKDYVKDSHFAEKITNVLLQIENQLLAFDEKYEIKRSLIKALDTIKDIIRQIDLQKLTDSSTAWLRDLDLKFEILEKFKNKLSEMKMAIQNFDISAFFQEIKDQLLSIDLSFYVEQISYTIPSAEIANVMESINDVIVNWIDEYEIPNKINTVYSYTMDTLLKYNLNGMVKELMDQVLLLIKEFKIEETVQAMVDGLKSINFELVDNTIMQLLHLDLISQFGTIEVRKILNDLNENISSIVDSMKKFDYSTFVHETNKKISESTNYINEQIKLYGIAQKIEAVREFLRGIQNSIFAYLNELKNSKVADTLKKLKNVIDVTFYNDIKFKVQDIFEDIEQRIIDMDIRKEMNIYFQRARESHSNVVNYVSAQFNQLIERIIEVTNDNDTITQIKQTVDIILGALKKAEIVVPTFTVPLTDLIISSFTVNLNKMQEISIPARIFVPEFTILNSYKIPAFIIDFEEIKAHIITLIDSIRKYEIQMPDPEEIFGDLKVLYLPELQDLTVPEITLSEILFPVIKIPKLNLKDFEITMLPIPENKLPEIPSDLCMPFFGKLQGKFRLHSPQYTMETIGKIENSTSTAKKTQFTVSITSHCKSPIEPFEYTFEANARLEAPRMNKFLLTEILKVTHVAFSIDHGGSLTLTGSSAEASAKTISKATTQMYTSDLVNNIALTLKKRISATMDTNYNHNLDVPSIETFSEASMKQKIAATMESGKVVLTSETTGNGKWSFQDYSDKGTHTSNLEYSIQFGTAKLTMVGETTCKAMKSKQTLTAESVILSHIIVEARCENEFPSVKKIVMVLNGEIDIGQLNIEVTAFHDSELAGSLTGFMTNSLEFIAHPFEIVLDVKNRVNSNMLFPFKLTGKVDLQHDYGVIINPEKQRACSFTLARFNQYKYSQNFTAENNDISISFQSSANGEAKLDFLAVPLTIPAIVVPYFEIKTPGVRDVSLWENAGFETLLTDPQQSFDFNLKLHYFKNLDSHSFEVHLEPIYNTFNNNVYILQAQFEKHRDKVVTFLKDSYNQARVHYTKQTRDTSGLPPRFFTFPGYKIPLLNIEVSAIRAEMPAFSYFVPKEVSTPSFKLPALGFSVPSYAVVLPSMELPVVHIPETLNEIKLPTFTLPTIQNKVLIPALGNITCDFYFKSTVITLSANTGLYNESNIVSRYGTFLTSVFKILNGKMQGTISL